MISWQQLHFICRGMSNSYGPPPYIIHATTQQHLKRADCWSLVFCLETCSLFLPFFLFFLFPDQSCSGGCFAVMIAYIINSRMQWNYLFSLMKSSTRISKQHIIDTLRLWDSSLLNPGELWRSFSVVTQMWFSGKMLPRELSTNICVYKRLLLLWVTHSRISVKLSTSRNGAGLRTRTENFCIMSITCV